jgi:hypothetical protein
METTTMSTSVAKKSMTKNSNDNADYIVGTTIKRRIQSCNQIKN